MLWIIIGVVGIFAGTSWIYALSSDVFGYVNVAEGRANYMYRNFLTRLSPTSLGAITTAFSLLCLGLFSKSHKVLPLFLAILFFATTVATGSRGNLAILLLLMPVMAVLVWQDLVSAIRKHIAVVLTLFVFTISVVAFRISQDAIFRIFGLGGSVLDRAASIDERFSAFMSGMDFIFERPLLGFGPGEIYVRFLNHSNGDLVIDLSDESTNFLELTPYNILFEMPHSFIVEVLGENGIIGILSFGFIIYRIYISVRPQRNGSRFDPLAMGLFFSILSYQLAMLISNFNNIMEAWIIFWSLVGLSICYKHSSNEPHAILNSSRGLFNNRS
jgi:O-antigen ligase